ncbi:MAG: TetR/AcrR family transcriptional regulator [Tomitella sp.]|nr:TetR/AcrR family transcriptional regulator [Tomitella sp.]
MNRPAPSAAPGASSTRAAGHVNARTAATRAAIMTAAERLFAERGVSAVSNRQIGEAAGQANNTAVAYHFGTKTDLIREIIGRHSQYIDDRRAELLAQLHEPTGIRDWVRCLVLPSTEHFSALGVPTWYARFNAQVMADPTLRAIIYEDALSSDTLKATLKGLRDSAGDIPLEIRRTRADMARQLLIHMCAEYERELALRDPAAGPTTADAATTDAAATGATWESLGADLVDALTGLWNAPITR